jgi:hypothetical protein
MERVARAEIRAICTDAGAPRKSSLSFNAILDGRLVVSEEIQITIEGEIVEQPAEAEAGAANG